MGDTDIRGSNCVESGEGTSEEIQGGTDQTNYHLESHVETQ